MDKLSVEACEFARCGLPRLKSAPFIGAFDGEVQGVVGPAQGEGRFARRRLANSGQHRFFSSLLNYRQLPRRRLGNLSRGQFSSSLLENLCRTQFPSRGLGNLAAVQFSRRCLEN